MKFPRPILLIALFCCLFYSTGISSNDLTITEVEAVLDAWSTRTSTRQNLIQIGPQAQEIVSMIARSSDQTFLRRSRAISLLGTFGNSRSVQTLKDISNTAQSNYRCLAMHALAEIGTEEVLSILVEKLGDRTTCMKSVSTDPGRENDVFVCDEAARLLELITGLSFGHQEDRDKRTKMWKLWWSDRVAGIRRPRATVLKPMTSPYYSSQKIHTFEPNSSQPAHMALNLGNRRGRNPIMTCLISVRIIPTYTYDGEPRLMTGRSPCILAQRPT
jgi:hypothetical protein